MEPLARRTDVEARNGQIETVAIYDRVQSATRTTPQVPGSRLRTSEIAAESAGHFYAYAPTKDLRMDEKNGQIAH
jgi:hypothetical protein